MKPTIGRIVYFKNLGIIHPALITSVAPNGEVDTLTVFMKSKNEYAVVPYKGMAASPEVAEDNQWFWPERV